MSIVIKQKVNGWNQLPWRLWECIGKLLDPQSAHTMKRVAKWGNKAFEGFMKGVYFQDPLFKVYREEVDSLLKEAASTARFKRMALSIIADGFRNHECMDFQSKFGSGSQVARLREIAAFTDKVHTVIYQHILDFHHVKAEDVPTCEISCKALSRVPPQLFQAKRITQLALADNMISWIPQELYSLSALQFLNLSGNRISFLSPQIKQLTQLQVLVISHNQLTALPEELEDMEHLEELHIAHNPIIAIPERLASSQKPVIQSALLLLKSSKEQQNDCKCTVL